MVSRYGLNYTEWEPDEGWWVQVSSACREASLLPPARCKKATVTYPISQASLFHTCSAMDV